MITEDHLIQSKHKVLETYEHPIALQVAGKNPKKLERCAIIAHLQGYDEINLNVGCPSKKIQYAGFGIYLIKNIPLLTNIVKIMVNASPIPVSIKTRIGLDEYDNYYFLKNLIENISKYGLCQKFIIHARKALSQGISTKENRTIPKLNYNIVYALKKDFPKLTIIINGNIKSIKDSKMHLKYVDGVMIGRSIYNNPSILSQIDSEIIELKKNIIKVLTENMYPYIEKELCTGTPLKHISRHMLGLFHGFHGCKRWKQHIIENSYKKNSNIKVLEKALKFVA